jgi:hypothetical protein
MKKKKEKRVIDPILDFNQNLLQYHSSKAKLIITFLMHTLYMHQECYQETIRKGHFVESI